MKNLKLGPKMLIILISTMVIGLGAFTCLSYYIISEQATKQADDLAAEIGNYRAGQVQGFLEPSMEVARNLSYIMAGMKKQNNMNREYFISMFKNIMEENKNIVGVWSAWEPDAFDGRDRDFINAPGHDATGRFIPYVVRKQDNSIELEPLVGYSIPGDGDYYLTARDNKAEALIEPYEYEVEGKKDLFTSLAVPVIIDGKCLGVVGVDLTLTFLADIFNKEQVFGGGNLYILSNKANFVSYTDKNVLGKNVAETITEFGQYAGRIAQGENFQAEYFSSSLNKDVIASFCPIYIGKGSKTPWSVVVNIPKDKIFEASDRILHSILAGMLVLIVVLIVIVYKISLGITQPITSLTQVIGKLSAGDTSVAVTGLDRADEIGAIAKSIEIFRENRKQQIVMEAAAVETQRIEDLTAQFKEDSRSILSEVLSAASAMENTAQSMSVMAEDTNGQASIVSAAAEQAAANVQTVAASTAELTASINEISSQVRAQTDITKTANASAETTKTVVNKLAEKSSTVEHILRLITDIAGQTNLLALNAAIEAARAGESGRGFAVVAEEVRKLAEESAKATGNISLQIKEIQTATAETVASMETITRVISEIDHVSSTISAAVENQANATRNISGNIQQAAEGIREVTRSITSVSKSANDTGDASVQVLDASRLLNAKNQELESKTTVYLAGVTRKQ